MNTDSTVRFARGVRSLRTAGIADPVGEMRRICRWNARAGARAVSIEHAVAQRARRVPFSHIVGRREFWTLEFEVTPTVLDPRPESETVIRAVLSGILRSDMRRGPRILDLGTGSGCLLLSLVNAIPGASGIGIDRSLDAVLVARRNARRHGLGARTGWAVGDWTSALDEQFDIVVSNPPYIESRCISTLEPEVRDHEPLLALDGGPDGLGSFRRLVSQLARTVKSNGFAYLEFGPGQAEPVRGLLASAGFCNAELFMDLDGRARCVRASRMAGAR